MPSKKVRTNRPIHNVPCTQEDKIMVIERNSIAQKECLIRIDEKLKVLDKLDQKVDRLLNGEGGNPGISTRITKMETRQSVIWFLLIVSLATIVGLFIKEVWPKIS